MRRMALLVTVVLTFSTATGALARPAGHHARTAAPRTATGAPITATDCEEHEAWVDGDPATVAKALPRGYTALTDSNGAPIVFARAEHCSALVAPGQRSRPVTVADWGIVVNTPDGQGCASGLPQVGTRKGDLPPICNWYTLALSTDDRAIVDWLRQGTPSIPTSYDKHLLYRDGPTDATGRKPFHFNGAGFTIDDVSSYNPGTLGLRGGYWFNPPLGGGNEGVVKMIVSTDDLTTGPADTTLTAAATSPLAHLMGATTRTTPPPYSQFGVIHADHGVLRKQLFGPRLRGERPLQSFSGSCDVQGDVTFNPPATNTQRPTTYTYDATGTCTGTVGKRAVSNAPVHLHQSGHADAGCVQALAFPPGVGVFTFADGSHINYTLDFTSEATELDGTAYGDRSGVASGHGTFLTQRSSPTITLDCGGDGLKRAPMDMSFATQGPPLISA
jgi:hypothetical protein